MRFARLRIGFPWLRRLVCAALLLGTGLPALAQDSLLAPLFGNHTAIVLLIEPDSGRIVDANPAAAAFYGYPQDQLRSLSIQDINTLGPKEVASERAKARVEQRSYFIFPHRLANGKIRTVEAYSSPVTLPGHAGPLLLSIIHDTTGRKFAEHELLAYKSLLEELVAERTDAVLQTERKMKWLLAGAVIIQALIIALLLVSVVRRRAAQRALAAEFGLRRQAESELRTAHSDLQRFAEAAAHHLMEPARRLVSYTRHLRRTLKPPAERGHGTNEANEAGAAVDQAEVDASLDILERDAERQRVLVRDIQRYLAAGEARAPIGREDAGKVVAALLDSLTLPAGVRIDVGELPPAWLDRPRLADLFSLLIENALRHGQPADRDTPQEIVLRGERDGCVSRYCLCDNGPGIPPEYHERIFTIFERLQADGGTGSGAGLSIARRIIESRRGRIRVENRPQGGTAVIFELPDDETGQGHASDRNKGSTC